MRTLLTLAFLAIAATGCRKAATRTSTVRIASDTLIAGTVIRSAGSWSASTPQGSTKLDLSVRGTSVNWTITNEQKIGNYGSSSGSSGSGMSLSSPSDPWFVFVESPSRLWFFDGKDQLNYQIRHSGGGGNGGTSIQSGKLRPDSPPVPGELVHQLPPDLQKLFPHVEPPGKRPSL
jgi:hypothetical protein